MPSYKVLSAADKVVHLCNLMVEDEEGKIQSLNVRDLSGEAAKALVGKIIDVGTTNRDIIPSDISLQGSEMKAGKAWICSVCGMVNPESSPYCQKCGTMRVFKEGKEGDVEPSVDGEIPAEDPG